MCLKVPWTLKRFFLFPTHFIPKTVGDKATDLTKTVGDKARDLSIPFSLAFDAVAIHRMKICF